MANLLDPCSVAAATNGEEGNACPQSGDAPPGIVGEERRGVAAASGKLASGRRREDAEETGMDSKRRRESASGSGACGAKMEEPAKSGKGEKRRATKTVIGTRERRTQGEPVVKGEAGGGEGGGAGRGRERARALY